MLVIIYTKCRGRWQEVTIFSGWKGGNIWEEYGGGNGRGRRTEDIVQYEGTERTTFSWMSGEWGGEWDYKKGQY